MDEVRSHISAKDSSSNGVAETSHDIKPATQDDDKPEHHILSFAELKTLIEQGKTDGIPHNRVIPDELNVCGPQAICMFSADSDYRRRSPASPKQL